MLGLLKLLFPPGPPLPNVRSGEDKLFIEAGMLGNLFIGKPGVGKTKLLARLIVEYMKANPKLTVFILDWSGSLTDAIFLIIMSEPFEVRQNLLNRLVYDQLGHREYVVPMPEFSTAYESPMDEQIERVRRNWIKLAEFLTKEATILGGVAIKAVAPSVFKVLTSMGDEPWQISEFGRLIDDPKLLAKAFQMYPDKIPLTVREVLTKRLINIKPHEEELRTYSLMEMRTAVESPAAFARLGYYRPGWTPAEAIKKGLCVIVDGAKLINQENAQHYLFTQVYSLIMAEINKRRPADPKDEPVALVLDEVYTLLSISGMAEEIGRISPIYRSRKLQLYVVIQALWQLADKLKEQVWNLGNVVSFSVENFHEAEEVAKQLLEYMPTMVKQEPRIPTQNPTTEPLQGQYSIHAKWIQNLAHRQCIIRRYVTESEKDPYIRFVRRTTDVPARELDEPLETTKERIFLQRAVLIRDCMEVINRRELNFKNKI